MRRTIDADALKEEIDYYIREAGWGETRNEALKWCLEFIDNQPTIEPERKKGKWPETEEDEYWRMWYVQNAEKHLYAETSVPNCVAEMMEDQNGKGKKSN